MFFCNYRQILKFVIFFELPCINRNVFFLIAHVINILYKFMFLNYKDIFLKLIQINIGSQKLQKIAHKLFLNEIAWI